MRPPRLRALRGCLGRVHHGKFQRRQTDADGARRVVPDTARRNASSDPTSRSVVIAAPSGTSSACTACGAVVTVVTAASSGTSGARPACGTIVTAATSGASGARPAAGPVVTAAPSGASGACTAAGPVVTAAPSRPSRSGAVGPHAGAVARGPTCASRKARRSSCSRRGADARRAAGRRPGTGPKFFRFRRGSAVAEPSAGRGWRRQGASLKWADANRYFKIHPGKISQARRLQ